MKTQHEIGTKRGLSMRALERMLCCMLYFLRVKCTWRMPACDATH